MTVSNIRFPVIQWTDIHDLESLFVKTSVQASIGHEDVTLQSRFAFRSRQAVSVALVPMRGGRSSRFSFGVAATLGGIPYRAGQRIDRMTTSIVVNPTSRLFYRVQWLGVDGTLIGSVMSSAWDAAAGTYVSNEAGGYKSGDLLALLSPQDLAHSPNLHLFLEEAPQGLNAQREAGYVL